MQLHIAGEPLTHSVILFLPSIISLCFYFNDRHHDHFSLSLCLPSWPNQSRHIWWGVYSLLLWVFRILNDINGHYIGFIVWCAIIFAVIWIIQVAIAGSENFWCRKIFQLRYPHPFQLVDGWFLGFNRHLLFECVLLGGSLHRQLAARVILLTI